jgi:hypothetical protein
MATRGNDGVIFEFVSVGAYVKVSAIDPVTGIEASIVGDPLSGETILRRTALRKLQFVLDKKKGGRP